MMIKSLPWLFILTKFNFISFCKKSFDCEINDTEILFSSPKSKISDYDGFQGNIIAPNEQKIIDIFSKFGPILNWWDLNELARKYDVSEASLNMMLQFSVLFKRIDRATYIFDTAKKEDYNLAMQLFNGEFHDKIVMGKYNGAKLFYNKNLKGNELKSYNHTAENIMIWL